MNSFNSMRRDLLRVGSLGVAGAAITRRLLRRRELLSRLEPRRRARARRLLQRPHITAPPATARPSTRQPSTAPSKPRQPQAAGSSSFPRASISASPSVSRATCISISSRARPSSPPTRRCPAKPPATTAAPTTPPNPRPTGTPIRTTATTTGTTRSSGARTSTTSPSPAPASSTAKASASAPGQLPPHQHKCAASYRARRPLSHRQPAFASRIGNPRCSTRAPLHSARRLPHVSGRAARRRQQGHRPQELPQRHLPRLLHPQGRPLRPSAHRRRQPHHRQSQDRHRPRRHGHRLLPERPRLQLHRQLALGRRHLPQVQLRPRLRPRHPQRHHHQLLRHRLLRARHRARRHLQEVRRRRRALCGTGRIKCGTESNGGFINITISNCVFEGCQGYALETVDGALLEDITITNITMRDLVSGPLFLRLGVAPPRPQRNHQGRHPQAHPHQQSRLLQRAQAVRPPSSAAFPATPSKTSSSPTSTSKPPAAAPPKTPRLEPPEQEDDYPEPGMFGTTPILGLLPAPHRNLEMSHVEIANPTPDARPAFYLNDVDRADFFAITAPARTAERRLRPARRQGPAHRLEPRRHGRYRPHRRRQNPLTSRRAEFNTRPNFSFWRPDSATIHSRFSGHHRYQ